MQTIIKDLDACLVKPPKRTSWVLPIVLFMIICCSCVNERNNPLDPSLQNEKPKTLTATIVGQGIELSWKAIPHENIVGYKIYKAIGDPQNRGIFDSVSDNQTTIVDQDVKSNDTYYYWLSAIGVDRDESVILANDSVVVTGLKLWTQLQNPPTGRVHDYVSYNGNLVIAGNFNSVGGVSVNNIAMWDGVAWQPLGKGLTGTVYSITLHKNRLIAGGKFSTIGSISTNNLAQWDGNSWVSIGGNLPASDSVTAITTFNDLLIVAKYENQNGYYLISSWDDTSWFHMGAFDNVVNAFANYDGSLLVAGEFINMSWGVGVGVPFETRYVTRWSSISWFPVGASSPVNKLVVTGGSMYAWRPSVAAFSQLQSYDGSGWSTMPYIGFQTVIAAITDYNGQLVIGTWSTYGGGFPLVVSWDGTVWKTLSSGVEFDAVSGLWTHNNTLYAKGEFTFEQAMAVNNYAAWFEFAP